MEIIWSPEAANDFTAIVGYIREDNAAAAQRVARSMYEDISHLKKFPN